MGEHPLLLPMVLEDRNRRTWPLLPSFCRPAVLPLNTERHDSASLHEGSVVCSTE